MTPESLVEAVARAIFDATPFRETDGPYDSQSEAYRKICNALARAAILATLKGIRDATHAQGIAGVEADDKRTGFETCRHVYTAMIDQLIKEFETLG